VIHYGFPATCGDCGSPLEHKRNSLAVRTEARALVSCSDEDCGNWWLLQVRMIRVPKDSAASARKGRSREMATA